MDTGAPFLFILSNQVRRSLALFIGKECHDSFEHSALSLLSTHPSAMQYLTMLFMTESGQMNDQIRKHKRREQFTGQKDRRFFVEVFSFDPKASPSRALKVAPLKRGLNCYNSYSWTDPFRKRSTSLYMR